MRHTPRNVLHESGERHLSFSTFSSLAIAEAICQLMISFFFTYPFTSSTETRPTILNAKFWPRSTASCFNTSIPSLSLQSSSVTMISWATSTSLRVRYPAVDVLNAVSAVPFLAPCVEIKYSSTSNPSLKELFTGSSMMRPAGLITSPFMPAICTGWDQEPRAPESMMEKTEPFTGSACGTSFSMASFTPCQISMTREERSSRDRRPCFQ